MTNLPAIAFIVCAPRSGSTLLTRILNSHSQIAAPYEVGIPKLFLNDEKESTIFERHIKVCRELAIDPRRAADDDSFLLSSILAYEKKQLLVIKDPRYAMFLPKIAAYYGDIPVVHLVRDVRAASQSSLFNGDIQRGFGHWKRYNEEIVKFEYLFSRFQRIKYESLTSDPETTVQQIVSFLGYRFEPEMLEYWRRSHTDDKLDLWGRKRTIDSGLFDTLLSNRIVPPTDVPVKEEVKALYLSMTQVRRLNERFGYC